MSAPALADHVPVSVDFNILVDASGAFNVFGEQFVAPSTNVIVADYRLPVGALYDSSSAGLIEIWEDLADPDDIKVALAHSSNADMPEGADLTDSWKGRAKELAKGLEHVLCSGLDCSGATPFNEAKYATYEEYTKPTDFGHLALGAISHYMFGHVNATAAITNDKAFMKNMLSLSGSGADAAVVDASSVTGPDARYAVFTHEAAIDASGYNFNTWNAGSTSDANLARRLVDAVVRKGLESDGTTLKTTAVKDASGSSAEAKGLLSNIVRQVIGQDGSRLMNEDNSERTKELHRLLRFYEDDVIYVNIKVKKPTVTVGTGQLGGVTTTNLDAAYATEQNYTIKITLGA